MFAKITNLIQQFKTSTKNATFWYFSAKKFFTKVWAELSSTFPCVCLKLMKNCWSFRFTEATFSLLLLKFRENHLKPSVCKFAPSLSWSRQTSSLPFASTQNVWQQQTICLHESEYFLYFTRSKSFESHLKIIKK